MRSRAITGDAGRFSVTILFFFLNLWINVQQVSLLLRRMGGLGPPVCYTGLSGANRLAG